MRALTREVHRTWFLGRRIPVSAWHSWRAERHRRLAQHHRDRLVLNSQTALDLAARYPSQLKEHA